jgi:deoxyadenosine/deoxycytidine kinase
MNNRLSIIGVEGCGKTYFINYVFNLSKYIKLYEPNYEINRILKMSQDLIVEKDKQKLIHDSILYRDTSIKLNKKYIMERDFVSAVSIFKTEDNRFYDFTLENYITNYKEYLPNIVIFMDTKPSICLTRIQNRMRSYELKLTLEDIVNKRDKHILLLDLYKKLDINVFHYNSIDDYDNLIKYIKQYDFKISRYFINLFIKPKVYVIEGNIGAGKSTLLNYYKKNNYTVLMEPFEYMENDYKADFLKMFYDDQNNKYEDINNASPFSLCFQMLIHYYKIKLWKNVLSKNNHKDNIILIERSMLSGFEIFTKSYILSNQEKKILEILYNQYNQDFLCYNANLILYIDCKPDICINRIKHRLSNKNELNIDLLRSIEFNYKSMLKNIKIKYKTIDNNDINEEELINIVNKKLKISINGSI